MIVVTGGSGFLGSWVVRGLHSADTPVTVLVRSNSNCWRLDDLRGLKIIKFPERDWPNIITQLNPRVVVASDWEGIDGISRANRKIQLDNVGRILAVARATKDAGADAFIGMGSQAEVGPHSHPITENEPDTPLTAYGEAKVELRQHLSSLFANSHVRFVWGRVFSIYGPLDSSSGMLPMLIRSLQAGKAFNATKGDQTWSYLYASDFASAVLRVINGSHFKNVVNIGNPEGVQISDVMRSVADYMSRRGMINFGTVEMSPTHSQHLIPVTSQLTSDKWRSEMDIRHGIASTVDWFEGKEVLFGSQKLPLNR